MLSTLGTGRNTAYIYDRDGQQRLLELPDTAAVEWGRLLCACSAAQVTLLARQCPTGLGQVHTWAHSVVVYRDDGSGQPERVWEGPLTRKVTGPEGVVTLSAGDVTRWPTRRAVKVARTGTYGAADELEWSLRQAMSDDDPNVTAHIQRVALAGPGSSVDRDVTPYSAYHSADLDTLVGAGARYTTVGRSVVIFTDAYPLGRLRHLVPAEHLLTGVTVTEDGDALGTRTIVRDDQGNVASSGGIDAYYGLVELLGSAGTGATGDQAARADALRDQSYPAPVQIDVPDNAQLQCTSPFPVRDLVPGMLWPVETVTDDGQAVALTQQLAAMKVTQAAGSDERVTVTLNPVSAAVL